MIVTLVRTLVAVLLMTTLCMIANSAEQEALPFEGTWKLDGRDVNQNWTATLILKKQPDGSYLGHFDWLSSTGRLLGRELFKGEFNAAQRVIQLHGYKVTNATVPLGLGIYRAQVSPDGRKFVNGTWGGPNATPGRWNAEVADLGDLAGQSSETSDDQERSKLAPARHTLRFYSSRNLPEEARSLGFSPNGQEVAIATTSGSTAFVKTVSGERFGSLPQVPHQVRFSEDANLITLVDGTGVTVYDRRARQTVKIPPAEPVQGHLGIRLHQKNGKLIIRSIVPESPAARDMRIRVGDELLAVAEHSGKKLQSVIGSSEEVIQKMMFGVVGSAAELRLISTGETEHFNVTLTRASSQMSDGKEVFVDTQSAKPVAGSVVVARDGRLEVVSPAQRQVVTSIWPRKVRPQFLAAISDDGATVAVVGTAERLGLTLEVHNVTAGSLSDTISLPLEFCHDVQFSPDGKSVWLLAPTRIVQVDLSKGRAVAAFNHEGVIDLTSHPDVHFVEGSRIVQQFDFAAFGGGFRWRVVDRNSGRSDFDIISGIRRLTSMSINPQGQLAIGTDRGEVHILEMKTGSHLCQIGKQNKSSIELISLSRDGRWLAYFDSGTLTIHDVTGHIMKSNSGELPKADQLISKDNHYQLVSAQGRFKAAFPVMPGFVATQNRYTATTENDGHQFEVAWMDFGSALRDRANDRAKLAETIRVFCQGLAMQTTDGQVERTTQKNPSDNTDHRESWTFTLEGEAMRRELRVTNHGGRLIAVMVTFPHAKPVEKERVDQFLGSLEVLSDR